MATIITRSQIKLEFAEAMASRTEQDICIFYKFDEKEFSVMNAEGVPAVS